MRYGVAAGLIILLFFVLTIISWGVNDGFTIEDRSAEDLGMVAVMGTEISHIRHLGSHFNDYQGEIDDKKKISEEERVNRILSEIERRDGLAQFFHPGAYTGDNPLGYKWYLPFYKKHEHLVGLEVFNRADEHPQDRKLWDKLLTRLMPDRPIWAFGNDDNHFSNPDHDYLVSWNIFLLADLTKDEVKEVYKDGRFFVCNKTSKNAPQPPQITSIVVTGRNEKITIEAENYDEIIWISEGEKVGSLIFLFAAQAKILILLAVCIGALIGCFLEDWVTGGTGT